MGHRRGILFMLFLMLFSFAYTIIASLIFVNFDISTQVLQSPWFIIFYQITALLLPLAIWLAFFKEKINTHLPHMKLGKTNVILIAGISLLLQPAMMVVSGLTTFLFPNEIGEMMSGMIYHEYPFLLLILAIAVTPAICEEVVFRGYIQSTYKNKPFWTMALINGLFFGIIHSHPQQFPYAFIMGIVFAFMVHATRSIRAGVISHFIMNASQITLAWGLDALLRLMEQHSEELGITGQLEAATQADLADPELLAGFVVLGVVAVCATGFAAYLIREFYRHNKKRTMEYDEKNPPEALEEPLQPAEQKRKNLIIDTVLILTLVALYLFFVVGI